MSSLPSRPKVPENLSSIVKPEELVDIVEMTPLTLQDRRIYNMLLGKAWNRIFTQKEYVICRQELVRYTDSHNQDLAASLRRLMAAIVLVRISHNRNGEPALRQIQLLGGNEIERGVITYCFPDQLIDIIKNTQIFARLHTKVMFALSSKYSLALYEFLQRRKNLQHIDHEILSVEEIRGFLGVGKNKLKSFGHLNDKAIKPAAKEVSFLTEYNITAEPIRTGRTVTHIKFSWHKKTELGEKIAAVEELERSEVGRSSRMAQTVEQLEVRDFSSQNLKLPTSRLPSLCGFSSQKSDFFLSTSAMEAAKQVALNAQTGWDIYALEQEFYQYAQKKGQPDNPDGAFIGFVKKKVQQAP